VTAISTHVLDTAAGRPAAGVPVALQARHEDGGWTQIGTGATNADGRVEALADVPSGGYRLVFDTVTPFFEQVIVSFRVAADDARLHIPLLLSPYGYSVYRGS
jgi:5-hydroxyisourate hydrolase